MGRISVGSSDGLTVYNGGVASSALLTLDASGNLLVGATSSFYATANRGLVNINGTSTSMLAFGTGGAGRGYIYNDGTNLLVSSGSSGGYLAFNTGTDTEKARIDSSGNLLVGLTTPVSSSRLRINSANTTDSTICGTFQNGNNSELFSVYDAGAIRAQYIGTTTGTALILDASGYIKKSSSSRRYKTNEQPIDIGLDFILGLEPISYDLIDGNIAQVGFIAEDFPDDRFVSRSMVDPSDESKGYQVEGVDYRSEEQHV